MDRHGICLVGQLRDIIRKLNYVYISVLATIEQDEEEQYESDDDEEEDSDEGNNYFCFNYIIY